MNWNLWTWTGKHISFSAPPTVQLQWFGWLTEETGDKHTPGWGVRRVGEGNMAEDGGSRNPVAASHQKGESAGWRQWMSCNYTWFYNCFI